MRLVDGGVGGGGRTAEGRTRCEGPRWGRREASIEWAGGVSGMEFTHTHKRTSET